MKKKKKIDRVLFSGESPLDEDWGFDEEVMDYSDDELVISGEMEVGKGRPVTIKLIDEVTGMEMEMNHVKNALLVVEDQRKSSSGWLATVIGDVNKLSEVLRFIARATVDELKKIAKRKKSVN
jgi:hypothetical protein